MSFNALVDWLGWFCKRDSARACLVLIDVSMTMTIDDLEKMRDYCDSLAKLRKEELK